jgi:hypothetical protein
MTPAGAFDEEVADRSFGIVEVRKCMAIRPAGTLGGCSDRASGSDGAKQHHATVAHRKATTCVQPDLVADDQPR